MGLCAHYWPLPAHVLVPGPFKTSYRPVTVYWTVTGMFGHINLFLCTLGNEAHPGAVKISTDTPGFEGCTGWSAQGGAHVSPLSALGA